MVGLSAFRQEFLASGAEHEALFKTIEARRIRYAVFWSMYEQNAYRHIHNWTTALKHQYALYAYIRNLYNPASRIGNFYMTHLWGGALNLEAANAGAIPIETESVALRSSIATLWKATNFISLKDVITLRGTIEGDVFLRVVDDTQRERVYLERIASSTVVDLDIDLFGNVKGYTIEEKRPNPKGGKDVVYKLVVTRNGDLVVFETSLNGKPYAWDGQPEQWEEPYTFVPMVLIKHLDVGLDWGWSELHSGRGKIYEVDDLASMVSDQIRKSIDPVWLMKGMSAQSITVTGAGPDRSGEPGTRPEPGREEMKAIWITSTEASAEPMVGNLDLGNALAHIDNLLKELERDYPELQADIWAAGPTSGRALRVARQRVQAKVLQRRESYDAGLVKAQQMAIAIGGFREYEGYKEFNLDSYAAGDLDHRIAVRPVFTPDAEDEAMASQTFWTAAKIATDAGADLKGYLEKAGWSDEQIKMVVPVEPEPEPEPEVDGNEEGEDHAGDTESTEGID